MATSTPAFAGVTHTHPTIHMPTTARLILIVAGTAAYLGLAILGWGGFAAFFSHPALIALAIVTLRVWPAQRCSPAAI